MNHPSPVAEATNRMKEKMVDFPLLRSMFFEIFPEFVGKSGDFHGGFPRVSTVFHWGFATHLSPLSSEALDALASAAALAASSWDSW